MQLTKAVLLGVKYREPVTLTHPATGETFEVMVRPLSDAEAQTVKAIQSSGLNFDSTAKDMADGAMRMKGDLSKLQEQQAKGNRQAVAFGLCMDETWSADEVGKMWPSQWVTEVATVIKRISGMSEEPAAVRQFREVAARAATDSTGGSGDSPGSDSSGPDPATT